MMCYNKWGTNKLQNLPWRQPRKYKQLLLCHSYVFLFLSHADIFLGKIILYVGNGGSGFIC